MKTIFTSFSWPAVVILLVGLAPGVAQPNCPKCDITRCENVTLVQESCPQSQLVNDPCACCSICASRFGEPCGGPYGVAGTCEYDLICTANPMEYLNGVNISGTCTRKVCNKNCTKKTQSLVCGDDGKWYRNMCAIRQKRFCNGTNVRPSSSREVCDTACQLLKAPENGNITFSKGIAQGSVANISCQSPYILRGSELRTCSMGPRGAAWNGTHPICESPCQTHRCERYHTCILEETGPRCVCTSCIPCPNNRSGICSTGGESFTFESVCGSDERTYLTECHLRMDACLNSTPDIYVVSRGKCAERTDEFPSKRKRRNNT